MFSSTLLKLLSPWINYHLAVIASNILIIHINTYQYISIHINTSVPQLCSYFHEQNAQFIQTAAIASISPKFIISSVLYQFAVISVNKFLGELLILVEFASETVQHYVLFYMLPVLSQWDVCVSTQPECLGWRWCLYDDVFHVFASVFHGLVVVLNSGVLFVVESERRWVEVAEECVGTIPSVELYFC